MMPPPKNRSASSRRLKNHLEFGKNRHFLYGTPWVLEEGVISPSWVVANAQNYNSTNGPLKILPAGQVVWPSLQAFGVPLAKSSEFGGTAPQKKHLKKF